MTSSRTSASALCGCGHPLAGHEHSPGVEFGAPREGEPYFANDDGTPMTGLPDVWICTGARLVDVNDPDVSPWDSVCGCVLHRDPSPLTGRAIMQGDGKTAVNAQPQAVRDIQEGIRDAAAHRGVSRRA